jgi:CubicO group peptidase (beta-lactamase class C family)
VAVVKGADTVVLKAYGRADLELDVPTPERATYEIGSVTKQFTAAALLQLVEQGKLSLDDDLTKFFPQFSSKGYKIPVRRLLDHTSGIHGYTEMPEFRLLMIQRLPRDTLVRLIARKPLDFAPGAEEIYSNSAYFLVGLIIEKVSGQSYADYVKTHLFDKAGMSDSYYCSEREIHKHHAHGYDTDSTGLILKEFLVHTWPYSAGSLCSSAGDLVRWNQALHGGKILGPAMYREMITPGSLNDGTTIRYAKGLGISEVLGHRVMYHGGGINGFLSANRYFPDESLSVVVLFNTAGLASPDAVALAIATAMLGKPTDQHEPFVGDLVPFSGVYKGRGRGQQTVITVAVDHGALTVKRSGDDSARAVVFLDNDTFGDDETRFIFQRTHGKPSGLRVDAVYGYNYLARQ